MIKILKSKKFVFILLAAIILALVVFGVFKFVNSSNDSETKQEIIVVYADKKPFKVKPKDPGGMNVPNMDKTIYDNINDSKKNSWGEERLLPAPEKPLTIDAFLEEIEKKEKTEIKKTNVKKSLKISDVKKKMPQNAFKIQLAAFKTKQEAKNLWKKIHLKHSVLKNLQHEVKNKNLGKKGLYYALQAGPFKNKSDARVACNRLIKGGQNCFIVK